MQKEILNFLEKIEEYLLKSNIHIEIVEEIMNFLAHKAIQNNDITKTEIVELVSNKIQSMMKQHIANFDVESCHKPYVMIVCGINGSGKTTTIGKMTNLLKECDWSVMIAACDTYRAAAETQLRDWVSENVDDFITMEKESDTPSKIAIRAYRKACENKKAFNDNSSTDGICRQCLLTSKQTRLKLRNSTMHSHKSRNSLMRFQTVLFQR